MEDGRRIVRERAEYGLSASDLERILPRLLPGVSPVRVDRRYVYTLGPGRRVCIASGQERERRLAGLRIPCIDVEFSFEGLADDERTGIRARFDRAFQKGGG